MAGQLTTEQVLLLNNLMYMTSNDPLKSITAEKYRGWSIGDIINSINVKDLKSGIDYGSYMTGEDWKNIINAIKADNQLMNMCVSATHIDNSDTGGGGASALFVDPMNNEAVVCYRGTASYEWKDNFIGGGMTGAADGVSTNQQQNALEWYQSLDLDKYDTVTVTGHSKGGNKAKYITIMDPSVDRCLSFDGQGFSDEFIEKYRENIAATQEKIQNHNVQGDYVNLLLNDVGETAFYEGFDLGEGGFLENHCPNTFFKFNEDGSFVMVPGNREAVMAELDEFLNSYMRTLSPEDKQAVLGFIGTLVESGFNDVSPEELIRIALEGDNLDYAANLLAYLIKYEQANPEFADTIQSFLRKMGMDNISDVIEAVTAITEWKYFDKLLDGVDWLSGNIPDWMLKEVAKYIEKKTGIKLSVEECRKILGMIHTMNNDMKHMAVQKNGADMKIYSKTGFFEVKPAILKTIAAELSGCRGELSSGANHIMSINRGLQGSLIVVKPILNKLISEIEKQEQNLKKLETTLQDIQQQYATAEKNILLYESY